MTITRIAMFDFDGTLFRSWEKTPPWWTEPGQYSFFIKPESLDEPCVPGDPPGKYWIKNAVRAAQKVTADPSALGVLVTGRVKIHLPRVKELLGQVGVKFDQYHFNPGMSAATFKKNVLTDLIEGNPDVTKAEVWENENQEVYRQHLEGLAKKLGREIEVVIHSINVKPIPVVCGPQDFADSAARVASRYLRNL